ncbi:hypothetical protein [Bythopirellula goksoeyrii]|uniref:Uncharacterized protein n=1 Tax=Bythopirellula goksoeyrii TaxID=1400387 RepID=A0A5B9QG51_9BACT|nr:hypothetical protein [Bythopirellula goksoeyrii]QEG38037.1 hypothetical protein Pr1d_53850 [Bythopirellula goksoeyrii]
MSYIQEFVNLLPIPFNFVLLLLLIVFGTGIITSTMKQIRKFACHRQELDFKREMIDRGMSVEEVERLVQASSEQGGNGVF